MTGDGKLYPHNGERTKNALTSPRGAAHGGAMSSRLSAKKNINGENGGKQFAAKRRQKKRKRKLSLFLRFRSIKSVKPSPSVGKFHIPESD